MPLRDDVKIRRRVGSLFPKESDVLTPVEIEDRFEKLDRRLDRIEQILPTLATKDDLKAYVTKVDLKQELRAYATKTDLAEGLGDVKRYMKMLHEDLVEKIKLLGEHRPKRR